MALEIIIQNISKQFGKNTVFSNLSLNITHNNPLAITGANGTGKSTLIKTLAGIITPDSGTVKWLIDNKNASSNNVAASMAVVAPYTSLIEEFSLHELCSFQSRFRKPINNLTINNILELSGLEKQAHTPLLNFSSGMKQKVKLTLALLFESKAILLDEPCSNLDDKTTQWYKDMLSIYKQNRLLVICSHNNSNETFLCSKTIDTSSFLR